MTVEGFENIKFTGWEGDESSGERKPFPYLSGGAHIATLTGVVAKEVTKPWVNEGKPTMMICFTYRAENDEGEQCTIFRDVKPSIHPKSSLYKDMVGMNGFFPKVESDKDIMEFLNTQVEKRFLVTVKNYTKKSGGTGHGFVSVSKLPKSMGGEDKGFEDGKGADKIDIDDIPF